MRRKALLFGLAFLPLFALCLWLYPYLVPAYKSAIVPVVNVGLGFFEPPLRMEVTEDGGWQTYQLEADGSETKYWYRPGKYLNLMFLGLALAPALLLATPVDPLRRLRLFALGMLLLFLLYLPATFGLVWSVRCLAAAPDATLCMWTKTVANIFGQLVSVALWGLLTWDVWLPAKRQDG
jgi:hypothetical protein